MNKTKRLEASHGIVYEAPHGSPFGYFGWPTVAKTEDGIINVAVSGFRAGHVCPWGKNVFFTSNDNGETWTPPLVINDTPIDDRDAGLLALSGNKLLLSWFSSDTRIYEDWHAKVKCENVIALWDDAMVDKWLGSFVRIRNKEGVWGKQIPVKVTAPHGPIKLHDGRLFYLGEVFGKKMPGGRLKFDMKKFGHGNIQAMISRDEGLTWSEAGQIPADAGIFCEPHSIELEDGKIIGMLRKKGEVNNFSIFQTESLDTGKTWSEPKVVCYGSPPFLFKHSSGTLICVYGYRKSPFGQRAMFSKDGGASWDSDWIIRDDGPSGDLGYPSIIELEDGTLLSVYYQQTGKDRPCSVLFSKWSMPELRLKNNKKPRQKR